MSIKKMPIAQFVAELKAAEARKDGYIMCATGQNPKQWSVNSWWFEGQYSGSQLKYALHWRENAARVWDCNGLAEGIYKDFSGVDINTKARHNYSQWCDPKGKGDIPIEYRVPGCAVFVHNPDAGYITHVGYLVEPVESGNPKGDWYVIEARGVAHGVVKTKLYDRPWNRWGLMTKYFDYSAPVGNEILGARILRNGCEGNDVKELQSMLIELDYNLGKWGADGDFGDTTERAVEEFQAFHDCDIDGIVGPETLEALEKAYAGRNEIVEYPKKVEIVDGNCFVRSAPNTRGKKLGVVYRRTKLEFGGAISENGWYLVNYNNKNAWVSGKYGKLVAE